jgi:hypothetical protein
MAPLSSFNVSALCSIFVGAILSLQGRGRGWCDIYKLISPKGGGGVQIARGRPMAKVLRGS